MDLDWISWKACFADKNIDYHDLILEKNYTNN